MGYSNYTTEFKIECVRRYFGPPRISIRLLALEKGVSFHALSEWIGKATLTLPSSMLSQALEALTCCPSHYFASETPH